MTPLHSNTPPLAAAARFPADAAVSWPAIVAGAAAAAALSLILLILGWGLGFSAVSPWDQRGISARVLGLSSIVWLGFTQLAASGLGGYLAGRLRTRWTGVDADETYFRDTAHGLLAWAVATLFSAVLLGSTISAIITGSAQSVVTTGGYLPALAAPGVPQTDDDRASSAPSPYFIDLLFRAIPTSTMVDPSNAPTLPRADAARILERALGKGLPPSDSTYLGQLVARHVGMPQVDAERRVATVFQNLLDERKELEVQLRARSDEARKASVYTALWLFATLLIGAFFASLLATFGGRQRDA